MGQLIVGYDIFKKKCCTFNRKCLLKKQLVTYMITSRSMILIVHYALFSFDRIRSVILFDERYQRMSKNSWAYDQYLKFKATPPRTLACIIITIQAMLGPFASKGLKSMTSGFNTIDFKTIGQEKTIVFLGISDTDRSKDLLANIFYSQAMNELCNYADYECKDNRLPVPVRFILDDFGTNCRIHGFENMISNIRSRDISATLILQSESQLKQGYGESSHTIIDNCDTIVYMGGNDVETAKIISERCNQPLQKVLNMPIGTNWTFRRGEQPKHSETVDLSEYRIIEKGYREKTG